MGRELCMCGNYMLGTGIAQDLPLEIEQMVRVRKSDEEYKLTMNGNGQSYNAIVPVKVRTKDGNVLRRRWRETR